MNSIRLANVNLFVADTEKSKTFYTDLLGLEQDQKLSFPPTMIGIKAGVCTLNIQDAKSIGKTVTGNDGMELAFEVTDVDALHQKLKTANVQGLTDVMEQGYGRTFDAKDPDSYLLTFYTMAEG
jgi:catechol 2,3-dioxygenase-like lactoylglutathione lyase family enzyme